MKARLPRAGWVALVAVNFLHWAMLILLGTAAIAFASLVLATVLTHDMDHLVARARIDEVIATWTAPSGAAQAALDARAKSQINIVERCITGADHE